MTKFLELKQRSQEWFEFREGKISGSMIPTIMGENPYETSYELWNRLINGKEIRQTYPMKRGIELESIALDKLNKEYDELFKPIIVQSDLNEMHIASLDGWNGRVHCEIKCPMDIKNHTLTVPAQYQGQLQWQMYVLKTNSCFFVSYHPDADIKLKITNVPRCNDYITKMLKKVDDFKRCMIDLHPPKLDEKRDSVIINDPVAEKLARVYYEIEKKLVDLQKEKEDILEKILRAIPSSLEGAIIGECIKLKKVSRKGSVSYADIPELKDVDLDAYRKPTYSFWKCTTIDQD